MNCAITIDSFLIDRIWRIQYTYDLTLHNVTNKYAYKIAGTKNYESFLSFFASQLR